jgi:NADP-dependent 3-hydroxy acid dehydrogenase YdfG
MKVAYVTGASAGIGEAVARALAADGYCVALVARRKERLDLIAAELLKQNPDSVRVFTLDVADEQAVEASVASVVETWGRIDVLFNNAGVNQQGTLDITYDDFDFMMGVNVRGAFNVMKVVVPVMKKQRAGYVINTGSLSSKIGFPESGSYCATKFALLGLSESVFRESVSAGLKVTTICPSWIATDMTGHVSVPHSQMIQCEDIVSTVRYLLSLSSQACPREIVIECLRDYGKR